MFWRISRQDPSTAIGCSELQEPPKKLTRFGAQSQIGGQIFGFSIDLLRRPYSILALLCRP